MKSNKLISTKMLICIFLISSKSAVGNIDSNDGVVVTFREIKRDLSFSQSELRNYKSNPEIEKSKGYVSNIDKFIEANELEAAATEYENAMENGFGTKYYNDKGKRIEDNKIKNSARRTRLYEMKSKGKKTPAIGQSVDNYNVIIESTTDSEQSANYRSLDKQNKKLDDARKKLMERFPEVSISLAQSNNVISDDMINLAITQSLELEKNYNLELFKAKNSGAMMGALPEIIRNRQNELDNKNSLKDSDVEIELY